jgi:hypothetical protein
MLQVSFNVRDGATSIRVSVRPATLQRAERLVESRYPSSNAKMVFPIEPESFFVENSAAVLDRPDSSEKQAA